MTDTGVNLRFAISLHQVGDAFTRDGDHLDWFFQVDSDPTSPVACFSTPVDVELRELPRSTIGASAVRLPDHRAIYLDFDGEVSGDRGSVSRWITGSFEWISSGPTEYRLRLLSLQKADPKPAKCFDDSMQRVFKRLRENPIILLRTA